MARPIEEHLINRLIAELCHARNEEAGVVEEAHRLAEAAPLPYTEDKMEAFCVAGDKMRAAQDGRLGPDQKRCGATRLRLG